MKNRLFVEKTTHSRWLSSLLILCMVFSLMPVVTRAEGGVIKEEEGSCAEGTAYTVSLSANPAEGGTVTGAGSYSDGEIVTVSASANGGYQFDHWTRGTGSIINDASFTFFIHENHTYEAVFVEDSTQVSSYTLVMPESVTITPYAEFTTVEVNVPELSMVADANGKTPDFLRLIFNGTTLTNVADSSKTISFGYNLYQSTISPLNQGTINITSAGSRSFYIIIPRDRWDPAVPGTYTGTIEYIVRWRYSDSWSDDIETGTISVSVTIPEQTTKYAITVNSGAGGGNYAEGASVTIMANQPEIGKQFKEWTGAEGLSFTSGSATTSTATFTMPAHAVTVTATYEDIPVASYTVTYKVAGGTWADGSTEDKTETIASGASPVNVPTGMIAGSGYMGGAWDTEPASATITGDTTFTYTFEAIQTYTITDDGIAQAYYYNDSFEQVFPGAAAKGTALSLWIRENARPQAGYYFTGEFSVSVADGVWASPATEFTMPCEPVTISAIQMQQEELTLTFDDDPKVLPLDAWMQIQFMEGEPPLILYDEASETETLDVNRDGVPDLLVTFPQDETTNDITLTRLPACAAFGSFAFTFTGPTDHYSTITFSISAPSFGPATFTLPTALTTIEASAFEGDTFITVVDAHNCRSIGAGAFQGCTGLTQIRVHPDCQINDTAFTGCGTVYVFAPAGGAAETSCADIDNCVFVPEAQD